MEFEFPKYPFVWDYSDMYNIIDYSSEPMDLSKYKLNQSDKSDKSDKSDELDESIAFLISKFPNSQVISSIQTVLSKKTAKNLNFHTWYLSQKNIFETTDSTIKIITDSKYKFKSNVKCFIFDPYDMFEKEVEPVEVDVNKKKFPSIMIVKKKSSIIPELIPLLYIHTHNIKGIFRFSPNDNNKIKIKESVNDGVCYIVLEKLIVKLRIKIK